MSVHAVPCGLPNTLPECLSSPDGDAAGEDALAWRPFAEYLQDARINLNVRQVLARDQPWPDSSK